MRRNLWMLAAATMLLWACGAKDDGLKPEGPAAAAATKTSPDGADAQGQSGAMPGPGGTVTPGGANDQIPGGGQTSAVSGMTFFTNTVLPAFNSHCASCHADPRVAVDVRGPLTIFSYQSMKALLSQGDSQGDSALANGLIDKVHNLGEIHTGGDLCASGLDVTPCKEISAWWLVEFGAGTAGTGGAGSSNVSTGRVTEVTALGRVYGWAVDPADSTRAVSVTFYADGPKGQGTLVGTVTANATGDDGNEPGDHAFIFDLPAAWRDAKPHQLMAYWAGTNVDQALGTSSTPFTAYNFTDAGRAYYEASVKPALSACQSCHAISYEAQYYDLIAPSPAQGGTATNNTLINKPSQSNGVTHGGGRRCSSVAASPCSVLQQWWLIEFGGA